MNDAIKIQYKLIQDRYVKVTWTHKIQECQGDLYYNKAKIVKTHITWFTVLTTGSALTSMLPWFADTSVMSSVIAFLAIFLSYFTIRYGDGYLEKKAVENKRFASDVHDLRNKYESLLADIKAELLSEDDIISRRNKLRQEEQDLYANAPYTSEKAVSNAEAKLKINRDSTTEDSEIEAIIPDYLKV